MEPITEILIENTPNRYVFLPLVYTLVKLEPPTQVIQDKNGADVGLYSEEMKKHFFDYVFACVEVYNATHDDQIRRDEFLEDLHELDVFLNGKAMRNSQVPK